MLFNKIRSLLKPFENLPIHPQWFARKGRETIIDFLKEIEGKNRVLDIGCFDKWPQQYVSTDSIYWGMDYLETASDWYKTIPDFYGDAGEIPVFDESFDVILILDVLEHLPNLEKALSEIWRVLKINGRVIMQLPFLYPIHDEPKDYMRLTRYGLELQTNKAGFCIETCQSIGQPLETAALLGNIAAAKTMIRWIDRSNMVFIFLPFLMFFILFNNIAANLLSRTSAEDEFMPHGYVLSLKKVV